MPMPTISKDAVFPISIGVLIALCAGIYTLSASIANYKHEMSSRLTSLEGKLSGRWTYTMEKESWYYFERSNPSMVVPDIQKIRNDNTD